MRSSSHLDVSHPCLRYTITHLDSPLDVVFWHDKYRSLNNRHLLALIDAGVEECRVRVWPLIPGLLIPCGSMTRCVVQKFFEARTSSNGGVTAQVRSMKGDRGEGAVFPEDSISQMDVWDIQSQLTEEGSSTIHGVTAISLISAPSSLYSDGFQHCFVEGTLFLSSTGDFVEASSLEQFSYIQAAHGELTRGMAAQRHDPQERTTVTLRTCSSSYLIHLSHVDRIPQGSFFDELCESTSERKQNQTNI